MTIARKALVSFAVALLATAAAQSAYAGLLIDRGLPTTNLNNAAGANRSNVAWVDGDNHVLYGDTFSNPTAFNYHIDTIRVWTVGDTVNPQLWGGVGGNTPFHLVSSTLTKTAVTYADGSTYQGYLGGYRDLWQLDFAVNFNLGAGQTFDFFLNGAANPGTPPLLPYLHASNAGLSGSPQQQADGLMLYGTLANPGLNGVAQWNSFGSGWDKPSDINVQVFGTVPDAGSTILLLGLALSGLGLIRRRFVA